MTVVAYVFLFQFISTTMLELFWLDMMSCWSWNRKSTFIAIEGSLTYPTFIIYIKFWCNDSPKEALFFWCKFFHFCHRGSNAIWTHISRSGASYVTWLTPYFQRPLGVLNSIPSSLEIGGKWWFQPILGGNGRGGIRTHDLQLRRLPHCPSYVTRPTDSLRVLISWFFR